MDSERVDSRCSWDTNNSFGLKEFYTAYFLNSVIDVILHVFVFVNMAQGKNLMKAKLIEREREFGRQLITNLPASMKWHLGK
jgi:hypothetical protein